MKLDVFFGNSFQDLFDIFSIFLARFSVITMSMKTKLFRSIDLHIADEGGGINEIRFRDSEDH